MELGISPIVTASMIIVLLTNTGLISYEKSSNEDRKRIESLSKMFALVLIVLESIGLVLGGQ